MRRKILLLAFITCSFVLIKAQSVTVVLEGASNPNRLELYATASGMNLGDFLSSLRVSVSWASSCNADLGTPTSAFPDLPFSKGLSAPQTVGANKVQILSGFNASGGAVLTDGVKTLLMSIPITASGGTPTCSFTIITPFTASGGIGGSFFAEVNGFLDITNSPTSYSSNANNIVLPVELLSFKGIKKGKNSQLQWETVNEKNLVNYIIERSTDGSYFEAIGFEKPKATNYGEKVAYQFMDERPAMGVNYYRLLSKGLGKDEKYSKIVSLDFGLGLSGTAFPNPIASEVSIALDIESSVGDVLVDLYDITGKQVLSKKFQNTDRRVNINLPTNDLAPGMYLIRVKVGTYTWEHKIMKQ